MDGRGLRPPDTILLLRLLLRLLRFLRALRCALVRPELALVRTGLALVGAQLFLVPLELRAVALDLRVLRERRSAEREECGGSDKCKFCFHVCPPASKIAQMKKALSHSRTAGLRPVSRRYFVVVVSCLAAFFASRAALRSALRLALSAFSFSLSALICSLSALTASLGACASAGPASATRAARARVCSFMYFLL